MEKKYENILFINGKRRQLSVSNAPAGISVTVIDVRDNPCECESLTKNINHNEALALADAIYKAEGYGWWVFTARSDVEVGLYDVTIEDLSHEIYGTRVATYNSSGRWIDDKTLSDLTLIVTAYRARPRPYEGEVE
jgi:hypothetical protein